MTLKALTLALLVTAATGCVMGNDPHFTHARHHTVGQELLDLQKARDSEIISEEEYQHL